MSYFDELLRSYQVILKCSLNTCILCAIKSP